MSEALIGLLIFSCAAALSYRLCPVLRARALDRGRVDSPGGRKEQVEAVPYGGGAAVFLAFCGTLGLGFLIGSSLQDDLGVVERHVDGLLQRAPTVLAVVFGAGVMFLMGRIDDRRPLRPGPRLLIQVVAALPLALSDQRLTLFIPDPTIQVGVALLWLVFITNATNFIDNMDGLLAGTTLIAASAFAALAALFGQLFVAAFALTLAGSVSGVLPHNRRPARIYFGDEGSMFIGFLLGALAMVTSYRGEGDPSTLPFLVPLFFLFVPTLDAVTAIGGRLVRGVAPWTAGRDHLSHRLVAGGFSPRAAVRLLQGASALAAALGLFLYVDRPGGLVAGMVFLILGLVRSVVALRSRGCE